MQLSVLAFALICIFAAAVVRGYAGFGFSLLSITALSLVLQPRQIIPTIFILEVCASIHLLAISWRHVHWQALGWLVMGCLIGTPLGVYALARAPAAPLEVGLASVVLIIAVLLSRGFALKSMPGRVGTAGTGLVSDVLNGALGVGGPPVVILFFSTPTGAASQRLMSKRAGSTVVEVKGSHAVYVSRPDAVAALIEKAANGVTTATAAR